MVYASISVVTGIAVQKYAGAETRGGPPESQGDGRPGGGGDTNTDMRRVASGLVSMKRCAALLLAALLWVCLASGSRIASAGAEGSMEGRIDRFLGGWLNDEYSMYMRLEDDQVCCRLTRSDSDEVWELSGFDYDVSEERLYCMNCIHYREFIDWDTYALVQEDWSLTGLVFAYFAFMDDRETLVACAIPYINGSLELQRASDEAYFGF